MGAIDVQVIYDPDGANRDITHKVLFRSARLTSSLSEFPGTWEATVKDVDRTESFTTGKRVIWKFDGAVMYAGFLTQVSSTFAFPVVNTANVSNVTARQFVLRGVDYNILFDKRVMRDPGNYLTFIGGSNYKFPRNYDGYFIKKAADEYLDLPGWLDTTTEVDNVAYMPSKVGGVFKYSTQGSPWRKQMNVFSAKAGGIFYIRPYGSGARLVYRAVEDNVAPYVLSDKPTGAEQGFRELSYTVDATGMVNDAMVWGGNEFGSANTGAPVVFHRTQNTDSITDHNRWQWAEQHFGDSNFASDKEVEDRAEAIVLGRTGETVYEQNRGLQRPNKTYQLTWFQDNVPKSGGVYQFIYPGDLTTLKLYVFGNPLVEVLPCRQVQMSFPNNDPAGNSYVQFTGTFSLQVNDPWQLWSAVKRRRSEIL